MAFKTLIAFGAGELTPELYERGNLDKFRTGLKTLRNAVVTKMGGLRSRSGTLRLHNTVADRRIKVVYIRSKNYLLEFSNGSVRVGEGFDPDTNTFTSLTDISLGTWPIFDDITNMHFTYGNRYLFVFVNEVEGVRVDLNTLVASPSTSITNIRENISPYAPWTAASAFTYAAGATPPTIGYDVDYATTFVYEGTETFIQSTASTRKKPVLTGESNELTVVLTKASLAAGTPLPDEVRFYQRPRDAGSYMFVGNAPNPVETATTLTFVFKDYGVAPDPTNVPPEYVSTFKSDSKQPATSSTYLYPVIAKTGIVYQDRLIFSGSRSKNRAFGTRTGSVAMSRDFPLQADSAVSFAIGSDGGLEVNRFFDGRGLMIFTTVGVYETATNLLTPDSAYAIKRGPYVADDAIEPLQLGGYITIYDRRLKAVIGLTPSGTFDGYAYSEFSIYSAHLLKDRRIVSWVLQDSDTSILWMVLDDGEVLSFSYQEEQLVRSWARHDFQDGLVEEVFVMDMADGNDVVCFCVNRDGVRTVERLTDRKASFITYIGTDASVLYRGTNLLNVSGTTFVAPVVSGDWEGSLTLTPTSSAFTSSIGDVHRVYVSTYEYIDLTVTGLTLGVLTVTPDREYPSTMATLLEADGLWTTFKTLTGLSHLNGKKVSVRVDGFTHASPLNTEKGYQEYTVSGGSITLAGDTRGVIISVGLPIVTDIETLEIDTVEQAPTKLMSQIVNKLTLSYFESLFFYAAASYPEDDTITGMENQEYQVEEDEDVGILYTEPMLPMSERIEMQIEGDWKVRGSVALRNVDPQPVALRAIIPDTEVIKN